jgi:hypothetical protein
MQHLARADVKVEQARQRKVNVDHFVQRHGLVQTADPREIVLAERQRGVGAQRGPLRAREQEVP